MASFLVNNINFLPNNLFPFTVVHTSNPSAGKSEAELLQSLRPAWVYKFEVLSPRRAKDMVSLGAFMVPGLL